MNRQPPSKRILALSILIMLMAGTELRAENHPGWRQHFDAACQRYEEGKLDDTATELQKALTEANREKDEEGAQKCLSDLAATYEKLNKNTEAETCWRELIKRQSAQLWPEHPYIGDSRKSLEKLLEKEKKLKEMVPLYEEDLGIDRKTVGDNARETIDKIIVLAHLYNDVQRYKDAEQLLRPAIESAKKYFANDDILHFILRENLVFSLYHLKKYSEAEPIYQKQIRHFEKYWKQNMSGISPGLICDYYYAAKIAQSQNRLADCERYYLRCLELQRDYPPVGKRDQFIDCLDELVKLCCQQKKYGEAKSAVQQVSSYLSKELANKKYSSVKEKSELQNKLSRVNNMKCS